MGIRGHDDEISHTGNAIMAERLRLPAVETASPSEISNAFESVEAWSDQVVDELQVLNGDVFLANVDSSTGGSAPFTYTITEQWRNGAAWSAKPQGRVVTALALSEVLGSGAAIPNNTPVLVKRMRTGRTGHDYWIV